MLLNNATDWCIQINAKIMIIHYGDKAVHFNEKECIFKFKFYITDRRSLFMMSEENKENSTNCTANYQTVNDRGIAIAGIIVGLMPLSLCLFAFNWFTFFTGLIGGVSAVMYLFKKYSDAVVVAGIICSTVGIIFGLINYPEVLDPIINCLTFAAWLLEQVKNVWGGWASSLKEFF